MTGRAILAAVVAATLLLGGLAVVALSAGPRVEPLSAAPVIPPRYTTIHIDGPAGEPALLGVQFGSGVTVEHVWERVTLPYVGPVPDGATGTSVSYLGLDDDAVLWCATTAPDGVPIDQDRAITGAGDMAFCAAQR